ncbi:hypothetical protein P9X10_00975 [Bacillus cereus]|nr:hypothetical protein [Bacillus cereus]
MKQFEYLNVDLRKITRPDGISINMDKLYELGVEGWDLAIQNSKELIFKREVEEGRVLTLDKKYKINSYGEKLGAGVLFKRIAEDESKTALALQYFYKNKGVEKVSVLEETGSEVLPYKPVVIAKLVPVKEVELEITVKNAKDVVVAQQTAIFNDLTKFLDLLFEELKTTPDHTISVKQISDTEGIKINLDNLNVSQFTDVVEGYKQGQPFITKEHVSDECKTVEKLIKLDNKYIEVYEYIYKTEEKED